MKIEDLKIGNIVEVRKGAKWIIGLEGDESGNMSLKEFCEKDCGLHDVGLLKWYDVDTLKSNVTKDFDIMKVWTDKKALFDDSIEPAWERSFLDELKINSLIWVRDKENHDWQIAIFKGLTEDGKISAASSLEGVDESVWVYGKEFKMRELEKSLENRDIDF